MPQAVYFVMINKPLHSPYLNASKTRQVSNYFARISGSKTSSKPKPKSKPKSSTKPKPKPKKKKGDASANPDAFWGG